MKKLLVILGIVGLGLTYGVGSIATTFYATPTATMNYKTAKAVIYGSTGLVSANTGSFISLNVGGANGSAALDIHGPDTTAGLALQISGSDGVPHLFINDSGTVSLSGQILVSGTVTANAFAGDGSALTNLPNLTTNVSGVNLSLSGTLTANAIISNTSVSCNFLQVNGDLTETGVQYIGGGSFDAPGVGNINIKTGLAASINSPNGIVFQEAANYGGKIYMQNGSDYFGIGTKYGTTVYTDRLTILASNGNVGIGTVAPAMSLDVSGTVRAILGAAGTGTAVVQDASKNLIPLTSSKRFKTDIKTMTVNSALIYKLRPVSFAYKSSGAKSLGFIAEEVNEVLPELVNYDKDGLPYSLKNEAFIPLLLQELKKLRAEVNALKAKKK